MNPKNMLIAVLCLVILGQAWYIADLKRASGGDAPEAHKVAVTSTRVDDRARTTISVEFDQPVPEAVRAAQLPATLTPQVAGVWQWSNPCVLRFLAEQPLPLNSVYDLALDADLFPDTLLNGERQWEVPVGDFRVVKCRLDEEASGAGPDQVEIIGRVDFNSSVDPEDLLKALKMTDADGSEIKLGLETSWRSSSLSFRSAPVRKTPQERELTLSIASTLTPHDATLTLGKSYSKSIAVKLDPVLHIKKFTADNIREGAKVGLLFSAPVSLEKLRQALTITPAVEDLQIAVEGSQAVITGKMAPGASYLLTLRGGFAAEDGALLEKDWRGSANIPNLAPGVDFKARGMFLPKQGTGLLEVEYVNTKQIRVDISRVFPSNLMSFFEDYGYSVFNEENNTDSVPYHLGSHLRQVSYLVAAPPNQKQTRTLDTRELIPDAPGLYKLLVSTPGGHGASRWVLRTDIGLVAKRSGSDYWIWAYSLNTLDALSGLEVRIFSDKNQPLSVTVTDQNGLARLSLPELEEYGRPSIIMATGKGGDFSFLTLDHFKVDTSGLDVNGIDVNASSLRAYVYGKRDIYRPGETLEGVILLRDDRIQAPANGPLEVRQLDMNGRLVRSQRLTSARGMAEYHFDIPEWARTGDYSLEILSGGVQIGEYSYKVEEFVPDRIAVEVAGTPPLIQGGAQLDFRIDAHYLFGPPAAGLAATAKARLVSAGFNPKGFEKYVFGASDRSFQPVDLLEEEKHLGEDGSQTFQANIPEGLHPPLALAAELIGHVQEQGGRGVTARRSVPVHVYPCYPGLLQPQSQDIKPHVPTEFEFVTVNPSGEQMPHPELVATLYHDRWQTVMQNSGDGFKFQSVRQSVAVATQKIPAGNGSGRFTMTSPGVGSYRVHLADPKGGAVAELVVYSGGWGYSPWALSNPARLELIPDKKGYYAGDTAEIQVRSPYSGKLLVTVEGRGVEYHSVHTLTGNTAHIEIPVQEEWRPNVHLTATLIRKGEDVLPGTPGRAFGAIPLFVDSLANKIPVKVAVPEEIRPERDLQVKVTAAPRSQVTVAIVDEGILQLIGGKNPDPFGFFYATRGLNVTSYDNFSLLYPFIKTGQPLAGGDGEEGGEAAGFVRTEGIRRIKPVTFWSGVLTTDDAGEVSHTVHLPNFYGALRVVAVANSGRMFGVGTAQVRVRSPLVLTATIPRFLGTGDEVEIPLTLRNDTGSPGEFQFEVTAEGPVTTGTLPPLALENGTERTVYLPLRSGEQEGKVTLRCNVSGNDESSWAEEELDQRSPLPPVRIMENGVLKEASGSLGGAAPNELRPDTVRRTLRLSVSPLGRFSARLDQLLAYPYGCAEQTTSKAFPLLHFGALAQEMAPEHFSKAGAAGLVQIALRRLQTMQTDSGGFAFWAGGTDADPWISAYIGHFLVEAQRAGFTIPSGMLESNLNWLRRHVAIQEKAPAQQVERAAYAAYVLALAGHPEMAGQNLLRSRFGDKLSGVARALLSGAYIASGQKEAGLQLLHVTPAADDQRRETGGNLGSGLRDRALIALILQDALPNDDPRLLQAIELLSRELESSQGCSTQETSLAFMALGKYMAAVPASRPFSGTLTAESFAKELEMVKHIAFANMRQTGMFHLEKSTPEVPVYYTLVSSGAPVVHMPVSNGLEIRQELLNERGETVTEAHQGDLLLLRTMVKGKASNVVVQSLLPAGLEVENPRLDTTEDLNWEWIDKQNPLDGHQDLRDDRILVFTDLNDDKWHTSYSVLRAVSPGIFTMPPPQAEAMYNPSLRATGAIGSLQILKK
ncbi:MAG: alpha-2-macroglobulin family protein [Deltaproteobacteria bacterium]|nr:alpha-2-macroglobulin family protein [Deltaproteobacteria bacterium]